MLFFVVSIIPMVSWATSLTFSITYRDDNTVKFTINKSGDADCIRYSIFYEDGDATGNESDRLYSGGSEIVMDNRPATITAYAEWLGSIVCNAETKYYCFKEKTRTTTYNPATTLKAPDILPALPDGATVTYSNSAAAAPTNPIDTNTGVITVNSAGVTDTYYASFTLPATPAGPGYDILNIQGQMQDYSLGSFSIQVNKKDLTSDMIRDIPNMIFTGSHLNPDVQVYYGDTYVSPTNYSYQVDANSNVNVGQSSVTIMAYGYSDFYSGEATKTFNIVAKPISSNDLEISLATTSYSYDGTAKTPTVNITVQKGVHQPVLGTDYKVDYTNNINAGTATATLTGIGNYNGTTSLNFTITTRSLTGATNFSAVPSQTYTGSAITPDFTATWIPATGGAGTQLVKGTDYTVAYTSNTNVGIATITITGIGNYSGTASTTFTIAKATPTVTAPTAKTGLVYNGAAQALVNAGSTTAGTLQYSLDGTTYGTTIPTGTNASNYTIYYRVVGDANYNDVAAQSLIATIAKATPTVTAPTAKTGLAYNGAAQALVNAGSTTGGTMEYSLDGATYSTTIPSATNVGTYTVYYRVVGNANYNDVAAQTVSVTIAASQSAVATAPTVKAGLVYNGSAQALINAGTATNGTMQYSSDGTTFSTTIPTGTNAGSYNVWYMVKGNTGYNDVAAVKLTATIAKATPTVTAPIGNTLNYTGAAQALVNAGSTTGGTLEYSLDGATYSTTIPTATNVGTYTVYYRVVGNANYNDVAPQTVTATIASSQSAISTYPTANTGLVYNGTAQALITAGSATNGTMQYSLDGNTYSTTIPTATDAGSYDVWYMVKGNTGYNDVAPQKLTVTIAKANVTVVYETYMFKVKLGDTFNPPYVKVEPAGLPLTYWSTDPSVAMVDPQTAEVTLLSPGEVYIYAEFAGDANYNSASDYYILTVEQAAIDPIDEGKTNEMKEEDFIINGRERNLSNVVIYDILFTLNVTGDPSESDGYDETLHGVVLNTPMSEYDVNRVVYNRLEPGTKEYAEAFTGLTFKVPAGKGYVIIDSQTDEQYQMMVKIGNLEPVAFHHTGREKDSVLYECSAPTWVYVYNGGTVSNARMNSIPRAKKTKTHVVIYSIKRSPAKAAGIEQIRSDALDGNERWYDLQGNRINRPTKKGVYILRGQKVVVK